jgi:hypothetical protein
MTTGTRHRIVEENQLPGAPPSEWDVDGQGDTSIQGFASEISIAAGEGIDFKVLTEATDYRIDIYRLGYYGGLGARLVDTVLPSVALPQPQPDCITDPQTRLYDCGNWAVSASWTAPVEAVSGIYIARLVRQDVVAATEESVAGDPEVEHAYGRRGLGRLRSAIREPHASHIYFVVRDDEGGSDILFQTSDTTWQAYNRYGGHSVYARLDDEHPRVHGGEPRAYKASYNRPIETRHYRAANTVFNSEYPFLRFLEANGYSVSYTTGVDTDRRGELLQTHRLFLSVGHDEYWSADQRRHVEAARAAGVHLAFFSGNEVFWKTRWESSIDGDETPHRTLVVYKETHDDAKIDPLADTWTGTWRDGRAINPEGPQPENALTGTIFTVNAWRNDPLIVPSMYAKLRLWRDTAVADLAEGEQAVLLKGLLGHEWDEDIDNGFRPPGLFRLSETTIDNVPYIHDHGTVYLPGTATHHLTLYRHQSGALVFGAGTCQWSWGLDAHHDTDTGVPPERASSELTQVGVDPHAPDPVIRQATVNLFADMDVQPSAIESDLVAAEASEDTTPPQTSIVSPTDGADLPAGVVTVEGTATDAGGGVVAAVEVSTDGGERWHPAIGRERWSYTFNATPGSYLVRARSVDDSANLDWEGVAVTVTVEG